VPKSKQQQDPPLVSVVTATYNMAQYLPEAIDSVLQQDYPHIEMIVVDDGSTDDTRSVLATYGHDERLRVISQPNSGQTVSKNRGWRAARGQLIAFLDADDAWLPGKLARQIPCFTEPRVAVCYGRMIYVDERGEPLPIEPLRGHSGHITAPLLVDNFVSFPTVVVRRRVLEEMDGFDESLTMSIDYDLWLRVSVKHEFRFLDEPLARYRIWEGQMSHRTGERLDNFFRLLEQFLADNPGIVPETAVRRGYAHSYISRAFWHLGEGRKDAALTDIGRALRQRFFDRRAWRCLVKATTGL
jgi:glycosyltransferase involved in cell wall biosynthesis